MQRVRFPMLLLVCVTIGYQQSRDTQVSVTSLSRHLKKTRAIKLRYRQLFVQLKWCTKVRLVRSNLRLPNKDGNRLQHKGNSAEQTTTGSETSEV